MAVTTVQTQFLNSSFDQVFTSDATGRVNIISGYVPIYRQISIAVATKGPIGVALTINLAFGYVGPAGLAGQFKNDDGLVHTYNVAGPNYFLYATGAFPNVEIGLQGWVFLN